ncbi:MAG: HD-GYP domain-containing protein [Actinomycetota bacterium]|nr:HD-GYP domain-containing protein [Actinomycetota bacterium]
MQNRPSRAIIAAEWLLLGAALVSGALLASDADWDLALIAILLATSVASDLRAIEITANKVKASGSFLAIVTAVVLLGAAPGALIGVITILAGWAGSRYGRADLLVNVVVYACFPLVTGAAFHAAADNFGVDAVDTSYYLLVFALFVAALVIDFVAIAAYTSYVEGSGLLARLRRSFIPILPSELAAAMLTLGITYAYTKLGLPTVALFAIVLLVFQYLVGELLVSQERAHELARRAKQLAGFQVALLGALLRTLDLRDRMTARHSAAVARYSRDLAVRARLSEDDQELAHTAGLLHDIGKFVLPDEILKTRGRLSPDDWDQIRRHPYEGARIVSQIDGYRPVGDIIMAHHERLDGLGYPRGLTGDKIPRIARILAVCDSYDAMTARDSYGQPRSSFEAIAELRRVSGTQLDGGLVELFVEMLSEKNLAYRHGEDVDFEAELSLDKRIHDYVDRPRVTH